MAKTAMVTTVASTAASMMTMNQAARFAACGEGWVIPMVLIKAFAMNWMNFISVRWQAGEIVAETFQDTLFSRCPNRKVLACIYRFRIYGEGLAGAWAGAYT
jgi:hypothetical protein